MVPTGGHPISSMILPPGAPIAPVSVPPISMNSDISGSVPPPVPGLPLSNMTNSNVISGHNIGLKNQTIYVNNLNEKIKQDELKKSLYAVFAQFGKILDIVTGKNLKMRGQAFVIFGKVEFAEQAVTAMQGFPFFNKPMRIQFAKTQSDVVAKANGTYVERVRRAWSDDKKAEFEDSLSKKKKKRNAEKKSSSQNPSKKSKSQKGSSFNGTGSYGYAGEPPPFKILFVQTPPGYVITPNILENLFSQLPGFVEVRSVPSHPNIAFVEYNTDLDASVAKQSLNSYRIEPDVPIKITFAKK